jgi:hypothetical protein
MDPGSITALVTGGCGLLSLALKKILNIEFEKNENENGKILNYYCIPKFKRCMYSIPIDKDRKLKTILKNYHEPDINFVFEPDINKPNETYTNRLTNIDNGKYIKEIKKTNEYLIIVPKGLDYKTYNSEKKQINSWQGSIFWFREFRKKSDTGSWYLDVELDCIKYNKCVKLFIKRFKDDWTYIDNHSEYITAKTGRNTLEAYSKLGEILEEKKIIEDNGEAKEITKYYKCGIEQIGLIVYSKSNEDVLLPHYGCCNKSYSQEEEEKINNKVNKLAEEIEFNNVIEGENIKDTIEKRETATCIIKNIYVGDISLYMI